MELQAAYGAYRPTPPTRPPNPNDDFGQVRGTILAHHSTMAHSALSRAGFYPQGAVAEIRRREAHSYAENLDQPFHAADDEDRDGGGSGGGGADGEGQADEDAWLEQQQSQQVARRSSPNTRSRSRSRSRSSPSRSRSAMDQRLQLYDDDEERQRRTRNQLEEAQKRMQQFQLTRAFPALRFKKATDSLPSGVQLVSRQQGSKSARSARSKSGQNTRGSTPAAMGVSGVGGLDIDPRLGGHTPAAARSFDEYHAQQQQLALQRAMERDAQAIRDGSYLPFDPASPLANYDSMRAAAAAAAYPGALMSTLSPRAHSRPRPHPPVRPPRLYHPTTNAPRSRSGSGSRGGPRPTSSVSIPSRGLVPEETFAFTEPFPHARPFLPCNPFEARAQCAGMQVHGMEGGAPGARSEAQQEEEKQQQHQQQFSGTVARSNRALSTRVASAGTTGRSSRSSHIPAGQAQPQRPPFRGSTSAEACRASTATDYYLNSADSAVKSLERRWIAAQAAANRTRFLAALDEQQRREREEQRKAALKDGRIIITNALPPRPLALDPWQDLNRVRYPGK